MPTAASGLRALQGVVSEGLVGGELADGDGAGGSRIGPATAAGRRGGSWFAPSGGLRYGVEDLPGAQTERRSDGGRRAASEPLLFPSQSATGKPGATGLDAVLAETGRAGRR